MTRIAAWVLGAARLAAVAGFMIANAGEPGNCFIGGDRPVTTEQVREKLQSDGWSNILIFRNGPNIQVTASRNGETNSVIVDSQTGRLRADGDDDDND